METCPEYREFPIPHFIGLLGDDSGIGEVAGGFENGSFQV
jgi:hypothetical protein